MTPELPTAIIDIFHEEYDRLSAEFAHSTKDDVLRRAATLGIALQAERGRVALANPDYAKASILTTLYNLIPSKSEKSDLVSRLAEINGLFSSLLDVGGKQALTDTGRKGGRPLKKEMLLVQDCWNEWQKNPAHYETDASFARAMMAKWGVEVGGTLASADSILKTMKRWKKLKAGEIRPD
jgi:hypothetical protein